MPRTATPVGQDSTPEERAESLKERIYVTFTSLAVVLALREHDDGSAGRAATTLLITVAGTLLAVLVADLLSHLVVHAAVPTPRELRHMTAVSTRSMGVVIAPLILLAMAHFGVLTLSAALRVSTIILIATLGFVSYLAVRRVPLRPWIKPIVLAAEIALAAAVVALELLAHG
jgi:hypothetical protein